MYRRVLTLILLVSVVAGCKGPPPTSVGAIAKEPNRLYWGDTHVHTSHSADAYFLQNRSADPHTAYRWAKGLPVVHPYTQAKVQIRTPLDFPRRRRSRRDAGRPAQAHGGRSERRQYGHR